MNVIGFWKGMEMELIAWKAKMKIRRSPMRTAS